MGKRIKKLYIFLLIIVLFTPKVVGAVSCDYVTNVINEYYDIRDELEQMDCENTTEPGEASECNAKNTRKALLLSKIFKYNDEVKDCNNAEMAKIVEENKDECKNLFGTSLTDIRKTVMNFFYILAPFLLLIFGSLDFFKIVVENDPKAMAEHRKKFIKRLIAFVLLFFTPVFINMILNWNLSNYSLNGNVYTCNTPYAFSIKTWNSTYVPPVDNNTSGTGGSSGGGATVTGSWHTDWFQCDSRWSGTAWLNSGGGMDNICGGGCGSLSTSIVCAHYSGDDSESSYCYPSKTANEYYSKHNQPNRSNTAITSFFNEWHPELGLTATIYWNDIDLNELDRVLSQGGACIADFQSYTKYNGRSVWTSGGHYVTIIGGNQTDGYRVADSNGGHSTGGSGISEWAPYSEHTFEAEYIQHPWYYYLIEKN